MKTLSPSSTYLDSPSNNYDYLKSSKYFSIDKANEEYTNSNKRFPRSKEGFYKSDNYY